MSQFSPYCPYVSPYVHSTAEPSVGIFGDNDWSTEVHEWDVSSVVSHSKVLAELPAPN